jgi:hypothetical protein
MRMNFARTAVITAAVLAAAGAGLGAALASTAGQHPNVVSGHTYYTNAGVDAVAGYFATSNDGKFMTHIQGYLGSDGTPSLQQLSDGYSDGQTLSLCNTFDGDALNVGDVVNDNFYGTAVKSVGWHVGSYGPTGTNNTQDDPCEDGELTSGLSIFPSLQNIPISDTVVAQILQYTHHGETCPAGDVLFEAQDITANPGVWYASPCETAPDSGLYNEASGFFTKDSTNVSAPAINYLGTFAHLSLTDSAGTHGSLQNSATWTAYAVDATGDGLNTDPNLLQVSVFSNDHFDTYAGSPTG